MLLLAFALACSQPAESRTPHTRPAAAEMGMTANRTPADIAGIEKQQSASGLVWYVLKAGTGAVAAAGDTVNMQYTGWLTDGTKFDSSLDRNEPFSFPLGAGRVIKGWDEGVAGMHVGEKRQVRIPSALGYGARGAGGVIPPNADLIFDVELVSIRGK